MEVTTGSDDGYFGINNEFQPQKECVIRHCQIIKKIELTSGQWEVKDDKVCFSYKKLYSKIKGNTIVVASYFNCVDNLFTQDLDIYYVKNNKWSKEISCEVCLKIYSLSVLSQHLNLLCVLLLFSIIKFILIFFCCLDMG